MSHENDNGRQVNESPSPCGGCYLEVWDTDFRGRPYDLVVSCFVAKGETHAQAVAGLLSEFLHPFGAAWDSPEQYGKELDAVRWLAEFYDVKEADCK
jgi:hypothetical protein